MDVIAKCERSGNWWAIEIPEVPGVFTQARRLDQVADQVADAVATFLDIDPATVNVTVDFDLPGAVQVRKIQAEAHAATERASQAMSRLVLSLRHDGYTIRDIGSILDVSPQRAHQLVTKGQQIKA